MITDHEYTQTEQTKYIKNCEVVEQFVYLCSKLHSSQEILNQKL